MLAEMDAGRKGERQLRVTELQMEEVEE